LENELDRFGDGDKDLLGISEAEPGFACVRIAPTVADQSSVTGTRQLPIGPVSVSWLKSVDSFTLEAAVPIGVHLQVRLPAKLTDLLYIDGEPISEDTQTIRTDECVELAVLPGNSYRFEVRAAPASC
jgi:hypothetical protein